MAYFRRAGHLTIPPVIRSVLFSVDCHHDKAVMISPAMSHMGSVYFLLASIVTPARWPSKSYETGLDNDITSKVACCSDPDSPVYL